MEKITLFFLVAFFIIPANLFISCSKDISIKEKESSNGVYKNFDNTGFDLLVKKITTKSESGMEEYSFNLTKGDTLIQSYVECMFDSNNTGYVNHYTESKQLIATLIILEGKIIDIDIFMDTIPTKSLSSWWTCTAQKYANAKAAIANDPGTDLLCDLSNVFFLGACTVGIALGAAGRCL